MRPNEKRLSAICDGPGAWTLTIGDQRWSANYVPELCQWTAYHMDDPDLAIGPKATLAEIKECLRDCV